MKTLNEGLAALDAIATAHGQINSFQNGQLSEVDLSKLPARQYPFLFAQPISATVERGQITYEMGLLIADRSQDDESDRNDVWSDTQQMLQDVVNHFRHSASSASLSDEQRILDATPVILTYFTERFDNMLTGCECTIAITADNENNLCLIP